MPGTLTYFHSSVYITLLAALIALILLLLNVARILRIAKQTISLWLLFLIYYTIRAYFLPP